MYYEYEEQIKHVNLTEFQALNRGEKEGILNVKINFDQRQNRRLPAKENN